MTSSRSDAASQVADDLTLERILRMYTFPMSLASLAGETGWSTYRVRKSIGRLVAFGTVKMESFMGFVYVEPERSSR